MLVREGAPGEQKLLTWGWGQPRTVRRPTGPSIEQPTMETPLCTASGNASLSSMMAQTPAGCVNRDERSCHTFNRHRTSAVAGPCPGCVLCSRSDRGLVSLCPWVVRRVGPKAGRHLPALVPGPVTSGCPLAALGRLRCKTRVTMASPPQAEEGLAESLRHVPEEDSGGSVRVATTGTLGRCSGLWWHLTQRRPAVRAKRAQVTSQHPAAGPQRDRCRVFPSVGITLGCCCKSGDACVYTGSGGLPSVHQGDSRSCPCPWATGLSQKATVAFLTPTCFRPLPVLDDLGNRILKPSRTGGEGRVPCADRVAVLFMFREEHLALLPSCPAASHSPARQGAPYST